MSWAIDPLAPDELAPATAVLAAACAFDRAADVAHEKLFAPDPTGPGQAFAARAGGELVGVASIGGDRLRLLAVRPDARGHGAGTALLAAASTALHAAGARRVRTLDLPGNYLAPGIDERAVDTVAWLERRGFRALERRNEDLLIDVQTNPQVSAELAHAAAERVRATGYEIRRARANEHALVQAIATEFGNAWPWEVERALGCEPPAVHVAIDLRAPDVYAGFAAHDGNNRGLGWFGPAGTWPAHRGKRLGEALLLACLVDVGAHHPVCEVAWIGPREFYRRAAGIAGERRFVVLERGEAR